MRPSFEEKKPLPLAEVPVPDVLLERFINAANSYVRAYRLGECSVFITKEGGKWHLSISHPRRYPTWDEIAEARYELMPDEIVVAMILPPRRHYVNLHPNCFQLMQIEDPTCEFHVPEEEAAS